MEDPSRELGEDILMNTVARDPFANTEPNSLSAALTFDYATNVKRSISSNLPFPGPPPACKFCRDLDFRKGTPPDMEIIHFTRIENVFSAHCESCNLIVNILRRMRKHYDESPEFQFSRSGLLMLQS